ncbi:MAG: hypothetical protein JWN70_4245, partial [Planctomycetaceae bacterium]|nr:hypothetical protein [Planctomycetaceae bacterium]
MSRGSIHLVGWMVLGLIAFEADLVWSTCQEVPNEPIIEQFDLPIEGAFILIPVTIRDKEYRFILDTGCFMTTVDISLLGDATNLNQTIKVAKIDKPSPLFE